MDLTRINEFTSAPGKADQLFDFLKSLESYIAACEGCISCQVLRHSEQEDSFVVLEKWQSANAHQASLANYPQEQMQTAMALIGAPPKGAFYHE